MGTDRVQKALADAGLPKPHKVQLFPKEVFSFRQAFRVDPQFSRTFIDPFLSNARRTRNTSPVGSSGTRRVEFVNATYLIFCPPEGGTWLIATKSLPLPDLQQAVVRFRDLIGMMQTTRQPRPVKLAPPTSRSRVALRA